MYRQCIYCGCTKVWRYGSRPENFKQIYYCQVCERKFVMYNDSVKITPEIGSCIKKSRNDNYSLSEIVDIVKEKYDISIHRSTVSRYINRYQ